MAVKEGMVWSLIILRYRYRYRYRYRSRSRSRFRGFIFSGASIPMLGGPIVPDGR